MREISHVNPHTGETVEQLFSRGPIVVADGGEANAVDPTEERTTGDETNRTMKDVTHTPPNDAEDVNRVFERGRTPRVGPSRERSRAGSAHERDGVRGVETNENDE